MGFEFRAVQFHVDTETGAAGYSARFESGMTVIRGGNTMGKSLLLQGLLYGVGLESLYATRKGTLTRAMTLSIELTPDDHTPVEGAAEQEPTDELSEESREEPAPVSVPVLGSWIEVLVANDKDELLTVRRVVKPAEQKSKEADRVRTWAGDVFDIDVANREASEDYLVGRPGVAVEERGFYRFFADFLGWALPQVPTYSGRTVPLYLQVVFGLGYVDQKRGWGGTVPQVPTTFQIIDPLRKAVEFVLQLDVLVKTQQRQNLTERQRSLAIQEERLRGRLEAVAGLHGGRARFGALREPEPATDVEAVVDRADEPRELEVVEAETGETPSGGETDAAPSDDYRDSDDDSVVLPVVEVLTDAAWVPLDVRLDQLRQERAARAVREIVTIPATEAGGNAEAAALERDLAEAQAELAQTSSRLESLNQDEHMLYIQLGALQRRLNVLDDEYDRYRQLDALLQLGSVIAPHTMEDGDCPTCHQSLDAVESIEGNALPVHATREAIRQDRATVQNLFAEAQQRVEVIAVHRAAWGDQVSAARLRVRALKTDLVAAVGTPSSSDIQAAVQQEQELAQLANLQARFAEDADSWTAVAAELAAVERELAALGKAKQSAKDARRLKAWIGRLRTQLAEYGFVSAEPDEVDIDSAMKPVVDGYDIGFQGSASDGIRLRWAYMLSLMETCAVDNGAHPGLLLMDEPGQQGVEQVSLGALYRHLLATSLTSGQVFVTTSEPPERLREWLGDDGFDLVDLGADRLLRRLDRE